MLRFCLILVFAGSAGLALGSENNDYLERSDYRVVGASLIDDQTAQMLEQGDVVCYRMVKYGSLLKRLKCRSKVQQNTLADKATK